MDVRIRRIEEKDYDDVLRLNEEAAVFLSPMDRGKLAYFSEKAALFEIISVEASAAGFLIALRDDLTDYDVRCYRWFAENCANFLYIDAIVTDSRFRGRGLAKRLYQRLFDYVKEQGIERLAGGITIDPYNEASLKLHQTLGFHEVGVLSVRADTVKVSLQMAAL